MQVSPHTEKKLVVEVGDYEVMCERLLYLVENVDERELFGARSREIALAELDVQVCASKHLEAFAQIHG